MHNRCLFCGYAAKKKMDCHTGSHLFAKRHYEQKRTYLGRTFVGDVLN